jgi:AraC family transcriptional regulator of arabinose operon
MAVQENAFVRSSASERPELGRTEDGKAHIHNLPDQLDDRVYRAISLVLAEPAAYRRLPLLAKEVGLSASRLSHLFQESLHTSIVHYLKAVRLCLATELLETTDLLVKQIVSQTGLGDERQFARDFRRAFGLPPQTYRRRWRQH